MLYGKPDGWLEVLPRIEWQSPNLWVRFLSTGPYKKPKNSRRVYVPNQVVCLGFIKKEGFQCLRGSR